MPTKFKKKNIDKITNFNPSTDTLEIDTDSFGTDSCHICRRQKKEDSLPSKLYFLYDMKKGGLYL